MSNFYPRESYFNFFNGFQSPFLNITWEVETVDYTQRCKDLGVSSNQWLVHALCGACMDVPEFRWRLGVNGEPTMVNTLTPSYTTLKPDGHFNFTTVPYQEDFNEFLKVSLAAKTRAEEAPGLSLDEEGRIDYIFITTIPWMRFTSIQHPVQELHRVHIPSFAFGKFTREKGKIRFPFSVQAHHGFVDGVHMHRLEEAMKGRLA